MKERPTLGIASAPIYVAFFTFLLSLPTVRMGGYLSIPVSGIKKYALMLPFIIYIIHSLSKEMNKFLSKKQKKKYFGLKNFLPYYTLLIWSFFGRHFFTFPVMITVFIYHSIWGIYNCYTFLMNIFKKENET